MILAFSYGSVSCLSHKSLIIISIIVSKSVSIIFYVGEQGTRMGDGATIDKFIYLFLFDDVFPFAETPSYF